MRIKEAIKEKGFTVAKVAELMNIQQTSLSRIINGGNTTVEMLKRIATVLGVPVTDLFQSESDLYGAVIFKGKTYRIDSADALELLYSAVKEP